MSNTTVPLGTTQTRRIHFTNDPRYNIHRFGGRPPIGLEPNDKTSRYLITLGIRDDYFVSIFLKDDVGFFIMSAETIFTAPDSCVEVFFHPPLPRREDDLYQSSFSSHGIHLGPLQQDEDISEGQIMAPDAENKIGGQTYVIDDQRLDLVDEIESRGFHQFLQLDGSSILAPGVEITGESPFYLGLFHFYLKPEGEGFDWCCWVESD